MTISSQLHRPRLVRDRFFGGDMLKKCIGVFTLAAIFIAPAAAQDAKTIIANAQKAGGYDKLNTIEILGSGQEGGGMGQAQSEKAGWNKTTLKNYSRFIDFAA